MPKLMRDQIVSDLAVKGMRLPEEVDDSTINLVYNVNNREPNTPRQFLVASVGDIEAVSDNVYNIITAPHEALLLNKRFIMRGYFYSLSMTAVQRAAFAVAQIHVQHTLEYFSLLELEESTIIQMGISCHQVGACAGYGAELIFSPYQHLDITYDNSLKERVPSNVTLNNQDLKLYNLTPAIELRTVLGVALPVPLVLNYSYYIEVL
jgi:hypothetical protein